MAEAPFQAPSSVEDAQEQLRRLWRKLKITSLPDVKTTATTFELAEAINRVNALLRGITGG